MPRVALKGIAISRIGSWHCALRSGDTCVGTLRKCFDCGRWVCFNHQCKTCSKCWFCHPGGKQHLFQLEM